MISLSAAISSFSLVILKIKKGIHSFTAMIFAGSIHLKGVELLLRDDVSAWLKDYKRLAILGIGNPLRSDDAIGLEVLKYLKGKVPKSIRLLRCEMTPENLLARLERFRPTHVLMIDASQLQAEPGEIKFIPPSKMANTTLFTHTLPITILGEIIKRDLKAKVMFLVVQPESLEFGGKLTPRILDVAKKLANIIVSAIRDDT